MDGSGDLGLGGRRTVTVLRGFYEKVAPRSEEHLGVGPSLFGLARLQTHSPLMAANEAGGVAATTGTVTHFPSQPPKELRLSRGDLTVLLPDRPAMNTGVHYRLPDIVAMRKCDLVRVLESMGQAVSKRQPTRLELCACCVTWADLSCRLCQIGAVSQNWQDEMLIHVGIGLWLLGPPNSCFCLP